MTKYELLFDGFHDSWHNSYREAKDWLNDLLEQSDTAKNMEWQIILWSGHVMFTRKKRK